MISQGIELLVDYVTGPIPKSLNWKKNTFFIGVLQKYDTHLADNFTVVGQDKLPRLHNSLYGKRFRYLKRQPMLQLRNKSVVEFDSKW